MQLFINQPYTATLKQSPLTVRGGRKIIAFPEGLETSCYHTATSERGCGWEDYPTLT